MSPPILSVRGARAIVLAASACLFAAGSALAQSPGPSASPTTSVGADAAAATGASGAARAAREAERWSRCNGMSRMIAMAAHAQDWSAMESMSRQQMSECEWNADMRLDSLENIADSMFMRGDLEAALKSADQCLAIQPARTGCQVTRAFVLANMNRMDEAGAATRAARAAFEKEMRDYGGRRSGLMTQTGEVAADPIRKAELESVDGYVAKLAQLDQLIGEMEKALRGNGGKES